MTQNCVASLSGVSASLYSLFESGKRIPSAKRLDSISSVLQLDSITRSQINALVANTKGLSVEDAGLSDEAQALLVEIRRAANKLPNQYVMALRKEIHELAKSGRQ